MNLGVYEKISWKCVLASYQIYFISTLRNWVIGKRDEKEEGCYEEGFRDILGKGKPQSQAKRTEED